MSATEIFDNEMAGGRITSERGRAYGSPVEAFATICDLKEILARCKDPELRHVLEMIAVKISRIIASPTHIDSWVDIAGYARTAMMVIDARSARDGGEARPPGWPMAKGEAAAEVGSFYNPQVVQEELSPVDPEACVNCGSCVGEPCRSATDKCQYRV